MKMGADRHRTVTRAAVALLAGLISVLAVGLFTGSGAAVAASGTTVAPYPPPSCITLAISTTTPQPGGEVEVTGSGYTPNSSVSILLTSGAKTYTVGQATTTSRGTFDTEVRIPSSISGSIELTTAGNLEPGCAVHAVVASVNPAGGHTPANTGVNVLGLVAIGGLLAAAGIVLSSLGRRRRLVGPDLRPHRPSTGSIDVAPHRNW